MKIGNAAFELADLRAEQEREHGIDRARQAVSESGSAICIDCEEQIEPARRLAAPFARRCFRCQTLHERQARGL